MSIFYPDFAFRRIHEIPAAWFAEQGISVLLLDVDNTLTTHNSPDISPSVAGWLARMKGAKLRMLVVSNNSEERVKPFCDSLGLGCISRAAKPLGFAVTRAANELGVPKSAIAIIGDQIFTDVLCGRLAGVKTILVEPIETEAFLFFKFKRMLERVVLKNFRKGEK